MFRIHCKHLINIGGEKNLFQMRVTYATLTLASRSLCIKITKIHLDLRIVHVKFSMALK